MHGRPDADTNGHTDTDANTNADCNSYTDGDTDTNRYANSDGYSYADTGRLHADVDCDRSIPGRLGGIFFDHRRAWIGDG